MKDVRTKITIPSEKDDICQKITQKNNQNEYTNDSLSHELQEEAA